MDGSVVLDGLAKPQFDVCEIDGLLVCFDVCLMRIINNNSMNNSNNENISQRQHVGD